MEYILAVVGLLVGLIIGFVLNKSMIAKEIGSLEQLGARIREEAQKEAATIRQEAAFEAKEQMLRDKTRMEEEERKRTKELNEIEKKLDRRETQVEERSGQIEKREKETQELSVRLEKKDKDLEKKETELDQLIHEERTHLERISGLTSEQAKDLLLKSLESDVRRDAARIIKEILDDAKANASREAARIVVETMQRGCTEVVNETTVSTVALPSDEIKGRIIGREGRNIRAFETITGVNLIIDDTPDTVVMSAFDPIRREAARQTLEKLIADGRIHPGRIEEVYEKVMKDMEEDMREAAERVLFDLGILDMNPEIVKVLGRLKYRYSYGQNQLYHARECAFMATALAEELGLNTEIAKRGALLHDLGKAVDFERDGTHASIGADICRKFGERPEVVNAVAAHHEDVEFETAEAILVLVADSISAARPGARRETIDHYVKRLEKLESIVTSFTGVEKCFAIQAGREVRVVALPDEIDDQGSVKMAYDISKKIEDEMDYPGHIKVTVIRETRSVAYAR
ncbi:MAG: ribonuclease Y [Candidatus Hinthialibacter antarcticus]|nr:ribonuclease Y [Candidatus Hinthialibacter antarcticus]